MRSDSDAAVSGALRGAPLALDMNRETSSGSVRSGVGALAGLAFGAVAIKLASSRAAKKTSGCAAFEPITGPVGPTVREHLVACRALAREAGEAGPEIEEVDSLVDSVVEGAKKALGGASAAVIMFTSQGVEAYPIFAQQNYPSPREASGRIACANCHLQEKKTHARLPFQVYPDTVFRVLVDVNADYEVKKQLVADGTRGPMNVGAIVVCPEGFRLAPRDRLPKILKKQMKGLAWSPYSKQKPNIVVAGPVPGSTYNVMTLPLLAPKVDEKNIFYGRAEFAIGANRGRGQVYPDGHKSNVNLFAAPAAGTVTSIEGSAKTDTRKVTITKADGTAVTEEVLPGGTLVVAVGDQVRKDQPISTNPNLGGFGQAEKETVLQDPAREQAALIVGFTLFLTQLAFVLKKKQFEKVQLAEGF